MHLKRYFIVINLFLLQIVIVCYFYYSNIKENNAKPTFQNSKVSFVTFRNFNIISEPRQKSLYFTENSTVILKQKLTQKHFIDFKASICYKNGTDLEQMNTTKWRCKCKSQWHGLDCGQPEIIWRSYLVSKKANRHYLRNFERRIIYLIEVDNWHLTTLDIILNELNDYVDLFVLYEIDSKQILTNLIKFKRFYKKLLYLSVDNIDNLFKKLLKIIKNFKNDDLIIYSESSIILNRSILNYMKLYNNNWPEPFSFRLKWCVYGFFWQHPNRTILSTKAVTVKSLMNKNFNISFNTIFQEKSHEFILGDLNHYGGWYCQFCQDPSDILQSLNYASNENWINLVDAKQKVDQDHIENLIGDGLYIDDKTELTRVRRGEPYYSPNYTLENDWKYDWLLNNIYSKFDY